MGNLEGALGVTEVDRRVLGQLVDTKALAVTMAVTMSVSMAAMKI